MSGVSPHFLRICCSCLQVSLLFPRAIVPTPFYPVLHISRLTINPLSRPTSRVFSVRTFLILGSLESPTPRTHSHDLCQHALLYACPGPWLTGHVMDTFLLADPVRFSLLRNGSRIPGEHVILRAVGSHVLPQELGKWSGSVCSMRRGGQEMEKSSDDFPPSWNFI